MKYVLAKYTFALSASTNWMIVCFRQVGFNVSSFFLCLYVLATPGLSLNSSVLSFFKNDFIA